VSFTSVPIAKVGRNRPWPPNWGLFQGIKEISMLTKDEEIRLEEIRRILMEADVDF